MNQEELIEELAVKYNVSKAEAKKAAMSQFKFVADKMGELAEIRLPYFGIFTVNHKKLEQIRKHEAKRKNNNGKNTKST